MKHTKLMLAAVLLAVSPFAAQAQEEEDTTGFNWNAAATSEYMFRGISQTDDHPALQAGVGYNWANGFYVGGWVSNVDFNDSTSAEVDAFVGWGRDLGDKANLDLQLIRYNYTNEPEGVNYAYNELVGKLGFADHYTATLGYTNDFLNTDTNSVYVGLGGEWEVGHKINLTAGVGYTTVDNDVADTNGYMDYSIGVNRDFGAVNIGLGYVGSNANAEDIFGKDNAEDKFVLTFSVGG